MSVEERESLQVLRVWGSLGSKFNVCVAKISVKSFGLCPKIKKET